MTDYFLEYTTPGRTSDYPIQFKLADVTKVILDFNKLISGPCPLTKIGHERWNSEWRNCVLVLCRHLRSHLIIMTDSLLDVILNDISQWPTSILLVWHLTIDYFK